VYHRITCAAERARAEKNTLDAIISQKALPNPFIEKLAQSSVLRERYVLKVNMFLTLK